MPVTPGPPEPDGRPAKVPLNHHAAYSVAFGVAAFACLYVFPFGAFALGVPSITTGVHARREIARAQGAESGDTAAGIGLIIGGAAIVIAVVTLAMDAVTGR